MFISDFILTKSDFLITKKKNYFSLNLLILTFSQKPKAVFIFLTFK